MCSIIKRNQIYFRRIRFLLHSCSRCLRNSPNSTAATPVHMDHNSTVDNSTVNNSTTHHSAKSKYHSFRLRAYGSPITSSNFGIDQSLCAYSPRKFHALFSLCSSSSQCRVLGFVFCVFQIRFMFSAARISCEVRAPLNPNDSEYEY